MNEVHLSSIVSVSLQHILAGCKEAVSLSSHCGVILERISSSPLQRSSFLGSSSGDSSPGLSEEIPASVSSRGSIPDVNSKHTTLSAAPSLKTEREQVNLFCGKVAFNDSQLSDKQTEPHWQCPLNHYWALSTQELMFYFLNKQNCSSFQYCTCDCLRGLFEFIHLSWIFNLYPFLSLKCCRLLVMLRRMKFQSQMTFLVLRHNMPFPCCRLKPWKQPAALSNLRRNKEQRPKWDMLFILF